MVEIFLAASVALLVNAVLMVLVTYFFLRFGLVKVCDAPRWLRPVRQRSCLVEENFSADGAGLLQYKFAAYRRVKFVSMLTIGNGSSGHEKIDALDIEGAENFPLLFIEGAQKRIQPNDIKVDFSIVGSVRNFSLKSYDNESEVLVSEVGRHGIFFGSPNQNYTAVSALVS